MSDKKREASYVSCYLCGGSGGGADALLVVEILLVVGDRHDVGLHGTLLAGHLVVLLGPQRVAEPVLVVLLRGNPCANDRGPSGFPRGRARHAQPCRHSP